MTDANDESYEKTFDWDEYLKQTGAIGAPITCFRQYEVPPANEFEVGQKIETVDPRNRTSICIATIIDTHGPRLRLRLDGTDDRNDFWLSVDSEFIYPFEYTTKNGGSIAPPLGFRNNISTWPRFFDKIIQSSNEKTFADEKCFKQPPSKPTRNEFRIGWKLEAIDQKNPHLICPATVTDIDGDQLLISFDGWSQSCNFWCHYASRDIYPVGWCLKADHTLQHPGSYEEKRKSIRRSGTTPIQAIQQTPSKQNKSSDVAPVSNENGTGPIEPINALNECDLNLTKRLSNSPQTKKQPNNTAMTPEKVSDARRPTETNDVDLSLVKSEAVDHSDSQIVDKSDPNKQEQNEKKASAPSKCCVYLNRNIDCGVYLDTRKFHANNKRFVSDTPKSVFKIILQEFINCAHDATKIFDLMQDGDSTSYIRFKTVARTERKYLPRIDTEEQLWDNIKLMCKSFSINENLFLKKKQPSKKRFEKLGNGLDMDDVKQLNEDDMRTSSPKPSSFLENLNENKLKRRSSNSMDEESYQSQNKLIKSDCIDSPYLWNSEQVANYIMQTDSNLMPYVGVFKYQEIDGRALLLLTTDVMMRYMGLKLGPALKLSNLIEKLKKQ